ncbi:MAG: sugar transferase [Sphingomonadales bacterium]|nr:sugar transferase [Sphingomonadales bacterium]
MLVDAAAILAGFAATAWFYYADPLANDTLLAAQLLIPFYWSAALTLQVYSLSGLLSPGFARRRALLAMLIGAVAILVVAFFTKSSANYSRVAVLLGGFTSTALILMLKRELKPLIERHCGTTAINVLVIDDGGEALRVPHAFHVDAREHGLSADLADPHMLDRIGLYLMNMDRVLVTCPPERRAAWALVFKSANVQGEIVDREVWDLGVVGARRGNNFGSLVVSAGPLGMRSRVVKRAFDTAVALTALLLLAPLLLLVALLIKLEDGGPVFFIQPRTGRGNRFFPIYKFRSMRVERLDHAGNRSASRDDDRVTRIGRIIRSTSIDELPQLLNVLRGDMSIVGPRPHAIGSMAGEKLFWEVDSRYWLRHSLKPGLTGLAQVRGLRGATEQESDLADRLQADLEYLDGWTVWRDCRIILQTAAVLVHRQAY